VRRSDKVVSLNVVRASKALQEELDKPEIVEAPRTIVVQPTMSKTDRLLACAFPWGREVAAEEDVGQPARFGSAFHELMAMRKSPSRRTIAKIAAKWTRDGDVDRNELEARFLAAKPVLDGWLAGENPWNIDFRRWAVEHEIGLAYNYENDTARRIALPDEHHIYNDARPNELPGAADIFAQERHIVRISSTILILDHKSGFTVPQPCESGQLKSLALAACRLTGAKRAIIGFPHAPSDSSPIILADELIGDELDAHRDALRDAFARIGDGSLKPGEHCKWCPALPICPAHTSALAEMRGDSSVLATAEDVGRAHQRLTQLRSQFKQYDALITAELRAWVRKNGAAPRPDGGTVDLVERSYESLSKSSIVRALGPIRGGREIRRLEKLGCVEESKRVELRKI
jgi:hypothetical protein